MNVRVRGTLLWCSLFESRWAFEKVWFLDRVYLISGAVSNIVQPRSQGFSRIEGKSANAVYVSGCVHVIDQKSVAW